MRRAAFVALLVSSVAVADSKDGFETYKGARQLCSEHVAAKDMHIQWASYATTDDVAKVIASYEKSTGKKAAKQAKGNVTIEKDKGYVLSIYAAKDVDKFPTCATKPTADEKTVILISQGIK
jgi:hypothetical protein